MMGRRAISVLSLALLSSLWAEGASAESIIQRDGDHPKYSLELEPHLALGFPMPGYLGGSSLGAGVRFSIPVAERGLIDGVNDSAAIGFGIDLMRYSGGGAFAGDCEEYRGAGRERICVRVRGAPGPAFQVLVPVVFQWNFFFDPAWSAFVEPGIGIYYQHHEFDGSGTAGAFPVIQLGGRYHFSQSTALTFRIGYPYFSLGVSFGL